MEVTEAQKKIIETQNKSLLISASAGSGKTFVVIERVLSMILNNSLQIDRILMVTFTNAAASEMKERLLSKLYSALDKYEKEDRKLAIHISKQIRKIPQSDISTIHSFCLNIVRENFAYLKIDPSIKLQDDNKSNIMIMESIEDTIDKMYETNPSGFLNVTDLFKSDENLSEILFDLYKFYQSIPNPSLWLEEAVKMYDVKDNKIKDLTEIKLGKMVLKNISETIDFLIIEIDKACENLNENPDFKGRVDILQNIKEKLQEILQCRKYDEAYLKLKNILPFKGFPPSPKGANEKIKKELSNIKDTASKEIKKLCQVAYNNTEEIVKDLNKMHCAVRCMGLMIQNIDEIYIQRKEENGTIDFSDCEHLALKALENEEIKNNLRDKYDEIYIDEYQDTSYIQEEILNKIAKENNKVMVGDVKQSIYGFRHARPDIFMNKLSSLKGIENITNEDKGMKIMLSKNFRSREGVIDSINYIFESLMYQDLGGADYTEEEKLLYGNMYEQDETKKEKYKTELNIIELPEKEKQNVYKETDEENEANTDVSDSKEDTVELHKLSIEAGFVADRIKKLINTGFVIFDKNTNQSRKCEYRDIVILMRSMSNNSYLIEEVFKQKNVPVYSDTTTGFYKSDEINLILSILKVIDNPYDDVALTSVMYSIVGGFTLDDMVIIKDANKKEYMMDALNKYILNGKDDEIKNKIIELKNNINRYRKAINIYSLSELVIKIYQETGIYNLMKLETNGNLKCANLDAFLEIVTDYEKREKRPLCRFLRYIENVKKKESAGDSPKLLGENENVVRIMTIHKSKGLEFPVVILMNASKEYNDKDLSKDVLKDSELGIGINILNDELMVSYSSLIKEVIKNKIKQEMLSEEMRLLYTALTRARDKCIIYGTTKDYKKLKEKLMLNDIEKKIPKSYIRQLNNYLSLLLISALRDENQKIIDINTYKCDKKNDDEIVTKGKNIYENREKTFVEQFLSLVKEKNIKVNKEYMETLKNKYNTEYKYKDATEIEQKYTATKLKETIKEVLVDGLLELVPSTLNEKITNTSYGTFIHKVLENIDIKNISEKAVKEEIIFQKSLLEGTENINELDLTKTILHIFEGPLKHMISEATKIKKEYEFVIQDDLKTIDDLKLKEETLIQGVIDLYLVTKDGLNIIIDFKTDNLGEEELKERYKYQLYVYKRAIQVIQNVEDVEMYIYSIHLGKLLKIE